MSILVGSDGLVLLVCGIGFWHQQDAQFVEQPDGQCHYAECEDVGGGGDDGGHYEDGDDGVASVARHEPPVDESHAAQDGADYGQLEDDAQHEAHGEEGVYIALQGKHVVHIGAHLIGAQETDGKRENEEIVQQRAKEEHGAGRDDHPPPGTPFIGVKPRRNEAEQFEDDVGRSTEQAGIDGHLHMGHELLGEAGVHEVQGKRLGSHEAEGDKLAAPGGEHCGKEPVLQTEGNDSKGHCYCQRAHDDPPQNFQMIPESALRVHRFQFLMSGVALLALNLLHPFLEALHALA